MGKGKKRVNPRLSPCNRLHQIAVPLVGLTGGIASGKSTVASLLAKKDVPVISADRLIKRLYGQEKTVDFIRENFPECVSGKTINFPLLRQKAFQDKMSRTILENFLHPGLPELFREAVGEFHTPDVIIYDIPLLFEKSLEKAI